MKRILLFLIPLVILSCQKRLPATSADQALVNQARKFFADSVDNSGPALNYRAAQTRNVLWAQAAVKNVSGGEAVVVPVIYPSPMMVRTNFSGGYYFHLNYLTNLVIYRDSTARFHALAVTLLPDSSYFKDPLQPFSGIKFVESWQGDPIAKLLYSPGQPPRTYVPTDKTVDELEVIETCYTISGYNYSADDPDDGYSWTESGGCDASFLYLPDDGGGAGGIGGGATGGGGGGNGNASATPIIPAPTSIIQSVKNYFQCFDNVGGNDHSYTITVCVDQPDPGTREPWTFTDGGSSGTSANGNPINAGHTFLILTESYPGTTITRNIGFYPSTSVSPVSPSSPGVFNDDDNHQYNISGSFTVDNAQFFTVLNYITAENTPGFLYNLNTNNCTTFAINAVAQAGINLPRTMGTWTDGAGDDPGDLGEDIRSGSTPGMTVNTAPPASHPNVGQCD